MVSGLWFMIHGLWFVVNGLWFMVHGLWSRGSGSGFTPTGVREPPPKIGFRVQD